MFIAVTYGLTALTAGILLYLARKQHHVATDGVDVFRYPNMWRYMFAGAFAFFLAAGFYVGSDVPSTSHAVTGEWLISWMGCAVFCALCLGGLVWSISYSVAVSSAALEVRTLLGKRLVNYSEVRSVSLRQGLRGARDLVLSDRSGKVLLSVGGTIQDFDELVRLVRSRVSHYAQGEKRAD